MKELLRSNDHVLLSFVTAYLKSHGIEAVMLDFNASIVEGSIGAIQRRLMVEDLSLSHARYLLREAGLPHDHGG